MFVATFFSIFLPMAIMASLFALICLIFDVKHFIKELKETHKLNLFNSVAIFGTLILFLIFASFSYCGIRDIYNSPQVEEEETDLGD